MTRARRTPEGPPSSNENQRTGGIYAWTRFPSLYCGFQSILGSHSARQIIVHEYIRPRPGERILDLGCGPATLLPYLGEVEYFGIDANPNHIAEAKRQHGARAHFHCGNVDFAAEPAPGPYDVVLCLGLLHHLDDGRVANLMRFAARRLTPEGRLVTVDPAFTPDQHWFARILARGDAGRCVRVPESYRRLAMTEFERVDAIVRHDLLRVPYTHCILTARQGSLG